MGTSCFSFYSASVVTPLRSRQPRPSRQGADVTLEPPRDWSPGKSERRIHGEPVGALSPSPARWVSSNSFKPIPLVGELKKPLSLLGV